MEESNPFNIDFIRTQTSTFLSYLVRSISADSQFILTFGYYKSVPLVFYLVCIFAQVIAIIKGNPVLRESHKGIMLIVMAKKLQVFLSFFVLLAASFFVTRFTLEIAVEKQQWGLSALGGFGMFFLLSIFGNGLIKKPQSLVLINIVLLVGIVIAVYLRVPSLKFFLKILPAVVSCTEGLLAGYFFRTTKSSMRYVLPAVLILFPVALNFNLYKIWVHKVEFGNYYGEVAQPDIIPFQFIGKSGGLFSNETEKGKVVLMDFWFIGCPPCWVKFPQLEALYTRYKNNPRVAIYAVNRPMKKDEAGRLFTAIEEKGYHFPVLGGTQEGMDAFGVYVYPTVVLLNTRGEVVFMGEIEKAEAQIELLLKE